MSNRRVRTSSEALFQEFGGEGVILDLHSSTYFGLDQVGVRLWQMLQVDSDLNNACAALLAEYDIGAEQLERDIEALVQQLVDAGLASIE